MIYRFGIPTTTDDTKASPLKTILPLTRGTVHQLDVVFPPGCAGTLHVIVRDALHQVWPTNPDQSFASDNDKISFKESLDLDFEPFELQVYTWLEDAAHSHTCIVRVGILPFEVMNPWVDVLEELRNLAVILQTKPEPTYGDYTRAQLMRILPGGF